MNPLSIVPLTEEIGLTKYLELQIHLGFPGFLLSAGDSDHSRENVFEIFGDSRKNSSENYGDFVFFVRSPPPVGSGEFGEMIMIVRGRVIRDKE